MNSALLHALQGDDRLLFFTTATYGANVIGSPNSLGPMIIFKSMALAMAESSAGLCAQDGNSEAAERLCAEVNVTRFTAGAADPYYPHELVPQPDAENDKLFLLMETLQEDAVAAGSPYFKMGIFNQLYGIPVGIVPNTSPWDVLACSALSLPIHEYGMSQLGECTVLAPEPPANPTVPSVSITLLGPDPRRLVNATASGTGPSNFTWVFGEAGISAVWSLLTPS